MDDLTASQLQHAYELIKAGQPNQARKILIPVLRAQPNLSEGWFLLGHAVSTPREKIRCFQRAVELDPTDLAAKKQLDRLVPPKKSNPIFFWGWAGLAGLLSCLLGLGLLWSWQGAFFASPAPLVPSAASSAVPTRTVVPDTATVGPSLTPRATSRPTITLHPTSTPPPSVTVIPSPTTVPSATPVPPKAKFFTGCVAPNGVGALTAPFKIENFGKEKALIHLKGMSLNGNNPVSCQASVRQGLPVIFELAWGHYEYVIFRGSSTRSGTLFINEPVKITMRIFSDKIQIGEFP